MKVAYAYPPGWDPHLSAGLAVWNSYVTRRVARDCETIVYTGAIPGHKQIECLEGVEYRRLSLKFDLSLLRYLEALRKRSIIREGVFSSSLYYIGYALRIAVDLRNRRCDIVHIYDLSQFVPIFRALNPKIRIVLHMHGEWLTLLNRRKIEPRLRHLDLILGCSQLVTNSIRTSFPAFASRCHTVYMGVDAELFHPNRTGLSDQKRLLYVGRISPEKGVHVLLEAFRNVFATHPDTELDIVGPDWVMPKEYFIDLSDDPHIKALTAYYGRDYRPLVEEQVRSHSLHNVRFRGLILHPMLADCYRGADIFIFPSLYESFGVGAAEAMATELPVVASRTGALPEVVEDGKTGILVQPGSATHLADAILQLLDDHTLRRNLGTAGRERAIRLFSWNAIYTQLLSLYTSLQT